MEALNFIMSPDLKSFRVSAFSSKNWSEIQITKSGFSATWMPFGGDFKK
jgi:hypothetical protein